MAIITISRQVGSLSHDIAAAIAEKFNWFYIDEEKLKDALSKKYNIDSKIIDKFDEKKPGLKDSFFLDNEKYFNYFKLYLFEKAYESKGCVLLGRGGASLLKDVPGVLRIRLVASEKNKIERTKQKYNCDSKEALKIMHTLDKDRAGFHKYYYHEKWGQPETYDIIFNTDFLTANTIGLMLEGIISTFLNEKYEIAGQTIINDRLIAQKIITKILYELNIPVRMLEVEIKNRTATLQGTVEIESLIEGCTNAAKIEGVDNVENRIVFVSQYPPIL
jgi:cytidylate kinase